MREYIAFDSHKRYTCVEREEVESGRLVRARAGSDSELSGAVRAGDGGGGL